MGTSDKYFNKKLKFLLSLTISAGLFFTFDISSVSAAGCGENQDKFSISDILNPAASLIEKFIKGFGYDVALAAPVSCTAPACPCVASCDVGCSGSTPTVSINWEAAPVGLTYYILTVGGVSYQTYVGPYYISSGLADNTTYDWSVEAYYNGVSSASLGYTNQPYGSFTTLNCAPSCPPSCGAWSACPVCGIGTQTRTCTNADCSPYTESQSCNIPPCPPTGLNAACPVP